MPLAGKSNAVSVAQTDMSKSVAIMEQVSQQEEEKTEDKDGRSPMFQAPIHKTTKSASDLINKILHMRMVSKGAIDVEEEERFQMS